MGSLLLSGDTCKSSYFECFGKLLPSSLSFESIVPGLGFWMQCSLFYIPKTGFFSGDTLNFYRILI